MMKPMILTSLLLSAVFADQPASALGNGDHIDARFDPIGQHREARFDRRYR